MATTTTLAIAFTTKGLREAPVGYFSTAVGLLAFSVELSRTCIISLVPLDTTYTWEDFVLAWIRCSRSGKVGNVSPP